MIYDTLANISRYSEIPDVVFDFVRTLNKTTPTGRYELAEGVYANVDEYVPKPFEDTKMEAHNLYIDIQLLLSGIERLDCCERDGLTISEEYDETRDVMFFENPEIYGSIYLDGSNFILLYPNEAHRPQIAVDNSGSAVKKVVFKIKVKEKS